MWICITVVVQYCSSAVLVSAVLWCTQTSLVSVEGLSRLVDPSQLTSDLGGSLEYDHVEWTELRLGLEEFSGAATQLLAQLEQLEAGLNRTPEPQDVDEARR